MGLKTRAGAVRVPTPPSSGTQAPFGSQTSAQMADTWLLHPRMARPDCGGQAAFSIRYSAFLEAG
jgi:hypothetical protein